MFKYIINHMLLQVYNSESWIPPFNKCVPWFPWSLPTFIDAATLAQRSIWEMRGGGWWMRNLPTVSKDKVMVGDSGN